MLDLKVGMKVTCPTKEDMIFALELLEDEGFTWINGGEKPTQWTPWTKVPNHSFPDSINFHSDEKGKLKICRGSYPSGVEWTIPISELFLNFNPEEGK